LAQPIESLVYQQAVLQLCRVNGDLGRLGALLKMWLTNDQAFQGLGGHEVQRKSSERWTIIRALQAELLARKTHKKASKAASYFCKVLVLNKLNFAKRTPLR
jgi:hypothetical protein